MRLHRIRVAMIGLVVMAALLGFAVQARWDAQCAAAQPGSHWNGDDWLCEGRR